MSPWQQVLSCSCASFNSGKKSLFYSLSLFFIQSTFSSFLKKKPTMIILSRLPPKQTPFLASSFYFFHPIHMSFHHLSSSPLFFGSSFHHPILSQLSAESIASGSAVCPLKRSGGITPQIPLWENKSRGRPVCEISYRQERDGRNQRGGDTQRGLCVGALLNQPCNASFYRRKPLYTPVISGNLL